MTGTWEALSEEWHAAYDGNLQDMTRVVNTAAYREGLVWDTIGAHPQGAKQPGFATWSFPPKDLAI